MAENNTLDFILVKSLLQVNSSSQFIFGLKKINQTNST